LDELIERYRKAANEKKVAATVRQIAEACNMSRMSAARALKSIEDNGFVADVEPGNYDCKRLPSLYRLTMFPYRGQEATHDYIGDVKEWRRAGKKRRANAPLPKQWRVSFNVELDKVVDVREAIESALADAT
jgi:hypothetical protein